MRTGDRTEAKWSQSLVGVKASRRFGVPVPTTQPVIPHHVPMKQCPDCLGMKCAECNYTGKIEA